MTALRRPLCFALLLLATSAAPAATGYKCTDRAGSVSFQDRPCAANQAESEFRYQPDRSAPPAPAAAPRDTTAAPIEPVAPPPAAAPPILFACEHYDGTRYYSDTGEMVSTLVPVGVLGWPPSQIGDAFRSGRSQLSAPEASRPPIAAPRGSDALAGGYTWVQDRCAQASPAEACAELRHRLDRTTTKRRRAFKDERATLEAQERDLDARLAGCQ